MTPQTPPASSPSALTLTAVEPTLPPPRGARRWCEGLPLVGTRALTIAERDELQVTITAARGQGAAWLCAAVLLLLMGLAIGASLEGTLMPLAVLLPIGAPLPAVWAARRARYARERAQKALAVNTVRLYALPEPTGGSTPVSSADVQRALHEGETLTSIGLLTGGGTLWTVNGRRAISQSPMLVLKRREEVLAVAPGSLAPTLHGRNWLASALKVISPFVQSLPRGLHLRRAELLQARPTGEQRALSNRERDELYEMSEQWKPLWPFMLVCGLVFGGLLLGGLQALLAGTASALSPCFYGGLAATGWPVWRWAALVRRCLALKRDYYRGTVERAHCLYPTPAETSTSLVPPSTLSTRSASPRSWPLGTEAVEMLPASGQVWTHDGEVASWRPTAGLNP